MCVLAGLRGLHHAEFTEVPPSGSILGLRLGGRGVGGAMDVSSSLSNFHNLLDSIFTLL